MCFYFFYSLYNYEYSKISYFNSESNTIVGSYFNFSYVNTKKSHIEKVEKIRKGSVKEGNTGTNNTGTNDDNVSATNGNSVDDKPVFVRVAEIVDRSNKFWHMKESKKMQIRITLIKSNKI